jgi:type VI secretion system protein VasG
MLVGAGGQAGQGDAANLLKPALARGSLRTIAATTWAEYKRYVEKDPALSRRFQAIHVAEPGEAAATAMLRGLAGRLEGHHGVRILDEALVEAVRLSHRYLTGRQLPDSAIGVLDTACARVAVAQSEAPPLLEDMAARAAVLRERVARLEAEARRGLDHADALEQAGLELERLDADCLRLRARFEQEKETVGRLLEAEARAAVADAADAAMLRETLGGLRLELQVMQDGERLVPPAVDARAVAEVVAAWTGIPAGRMLADTVATARDLARRMAARIVGQDQALEAITRRIQTFYAELGEPGKPTGVFLLVGPSGVGKTETAVTLADLLFGGPRALVTVNMTEYQEAHSVSGLKGAPPGYVGYGRGGILTEAVRRRPYCVLLLDEIEKAHKDVVELFYQIFDKGQIEDSEGQLVSFKDCVVLMTSNVGAEIVAERVQRDPAIDADALAEAIRPALLRHFPPAFLGRLVTVPYRPLGPAEIGAIVRMKLARIQERLATTHGAELTWDEAVMRAIAARAGATDSGARNVDAILTQTLLPELSMRLLDRLATGERFASAHIGLGRDGRLAFELFA